MKGESADLHKCGFADFIDTLFKLNGMKDKLFKYLLFGACCLILLLSGGIIYALVSSSVEVFSHFGFCDQQPQGCLSSD